MLKMDLTSFVHRVLFGTPEAYTPVAFDSGRFGPSGEWWIRVDAEGRRPLLTSGDRAAWTLEEYEFEGPGPAGGR